MRVGPGSGALEVWNEFQRTRMPQRGSVRPWDSWPLDVMEVGVGWIMVIRDEDTRPVGMGPSVLFPSTESPSWDDSNVYPGP